MLEIEKQEIKNISFAIALGSSAVWSKEGSENLDRFLNDVDTEHEMTPEELNIFLSGL